MKCNYCEEKAIMAYDETSAFRGAYCCEHSELFIPLTDNKECFPSEGRIWKQMKCNNDKCKVVLRYDIGIDRGDMFLCPRHLIIYYHFKNEKKLSHNESIKMAMI